MNTISIIIGIVGGIFGLLGLVSVAVVYARGATAKATIESQASYIDSLEKERDQKEKEREYWKQQAHEREGVIKTLRGGVVKDLVTDIIAEFGKRSPRKGKRSK